MLDAYKDELAHLTPEELAELDSLLNDRVWVPWPDSPQLEAYNCEADIFGFTAALLAGGRRICW